MKKKKTGLTKLCDIFESCKKIPPLFQRTATLKTSWTNDNPGRRFRVCPMSRGGGDSPNCGFFMWVDPPMCRRGRVIIPGLLRKLKAQDEEIHAIKKMLLLMAATTVFLSFLLVFQFMG